ncbi:MAG: hypothetical protein GXP45_02765 [bacterium]|nr:hypothetical protein [bacterium]
MLSFAFAIPSETSGGDNQDTTGIVINSGEETPEIIIDPVTKKIYVTTGYFQNTGVTPEENNLDGDSSFTGNST